jgi:ionotropic glutamate receptor NMDA 2B
MKRIKFLFRFNILDIYTIKKKNRNEIIKELQDLSVSEARVILLYSTKEEAQEIMAAAESLKMTGKNYMWIVTQSVLGGGADYAPGEFPPGMLGMNSLQIKNKMNCFFFIILFFLILSVF